MAEASTSNSTDAPNPTTPFEDVPAPWQCKGESFWFFGHAGGGRDKYPPPAAFGDMERATAWSDPTLTGDYKGGLTSIMIVRYQDTPVGPYDEIVWSPGIFTVPVGGPDAQRITRIYVSTVASVYNGRKNWNVPKQLARFEFTSNPDAKKKSDLPYSKISVADPSDPEHPFFVADLSSSWFSSAGLPFNSTWMPMNQLLVMPPLPQHSNCHDPSDGRVGTNRWCSLQPLMKGKMGPFWSNGGLLEGKYGDGIGFPDVKPWSLGLWLRDFHLDFSVGTQVGDTTTEIEVLDK